LADFSGTALNDIPVLDDLAVLELEYVDDGGSEERRLSVG
jgi:hypothetical protein